MKKCIFALLMLIAVVTVPLFSQWTSDPTQNTPVCTDPLNQLKPLIVTDGDGGAIIAWHDQLYSGDFNLYVQRIDKYGYIQWNERGVPICTAAKKQWLSDMVSDGNGGAFLCWDDYRHCTILPPAGMEDSITVYLQHINGDGEVLWETDGILLSHEPGDRRLANMVSDENGGFIISWYEHGEGAYPAGIYAQRLNANGELIWPGFGVEVDPGGELRSITTEEDGLGGVIFSSLTSGIQRIDSTGNLVWINEDVWSYRIMHDGNGGAISYYIDKDHPDSLFTYTLYVTGIDSNGEVKWVTTDYLFGLEESEDFSVSELISDDLGGAIMSWRDFRNGNSDIFAQRVDSSGSLVWQSGGVCICCENSGQGIPTLIKDNSNGAYIFWNDTRYVDNNIYSIYSQRIDKSGEILWNKIGNPVSVREEGYQTYPVAITAENGGFIVTWSDGQNPWDIYAQRVDSSGILGNPTTVKEINNASPLTFSLRQNYPNPFNATTTIHYQLSNIRPQNTILKIYNLFGKEVRTLVTQKQVLGSYQVIWNGQNNQGGDVASGIYLYQLTSGSFKQTKKLTVIK